MKDWKTIGRRLLFPPLWLMILMTVFSAVALVSVFVKGWETHPVAYVIYVVSFYTLTVICLLCWKTLPGYYKSAKRKVYDNKYANRYLTDAVFKTHVNLYRSLTINLMYVAFNAVMGLVYGTWWFGIFALYYAIMAIMRFLLVRYARRNSIGKQRLAELKLARLCAYILMTVNLALSGAVLMMVYYNRGFAYQGILIYVMAMYTFYALTMSVVDLVRYRSMGSPVMSTAKIVSLSAALVSMLNMETAMFAQFGAEMPQEHQRIFIILTGAGVSVTVVALSAFLIVKATKEIRREKNG
jgi:hypothetical protein